MIKAVIFDMDGVIVDSEPVHFQVERALFADLGIELSRKMHDAFVGTTPEAMWGELKRKYGFAESIEEMEAARVRRIREAFENGEVRLVKGCVDLIKRLHFEKFRLGLASSSPREHIDAVLQRFDLVQFFDVVLSGEEVSNGKPAPDIFLEAAKRLGVDAAECLVIEDSRNGVSAAKAAGMKCVGFQNPASGEQDLSKADEIIEDFGDFDVKLLV